MADNCIFCEIMAGELPVSMVYRDGDVAVFMDIQPVNAGHMLVVPIMHAADLAELDEETGGKLFSVGQKMAAALYLSDLPAEGVNFFLADGEAAGQEVFHVHLHVFPRFEGDGFGFRFREEYFELPPRKELDMAAAAIRERL